MRWMVGYLVMSTLKRCGVEDLRHQAEVGHGRLIAVAVGAGVAIPATDAS